MTQTTFPEWPDIAPDLIARPEPQVSDMGLVDRRNFEQIDIVGTPA